MRLTHDYRLAGVPPSYADMVRAIAAMEHLRDGWNGGRAPQIGKRAREAAAEFIFSTVDVGIPAPDEVGPTPDGGVAMSWTLATDDGDRELDIVVFDWHRLEYREGLADSDGFAEEVVTDEDGVRQRLLRAIEAARHAA